MSARVTDVGRRLQIIILLALLLRVILTFAYQPGWDYMNPDEERSYQVAQNYLAGHGYTVWNEQTQQWDQTAFHAPFNMFVYIKLLQWGIPKTWWVAFIHLLSIVLYAISAQYFFKLAKKLLEEQYAFWATVVYLFFPSVIFYIGILFAYENITLSFLIITMWQVSRIMNKEWSPYYWVTIPFMVTVSVLMRPNMLMLYGLLLAAMFFISLRRKNYKFLALSPVIIITLLLAHIPSLKKNYEQFGVYILSNQSGYELIQGHSPVARGSWMGNWQTPGNPLYEYVTASVPGINEMNEYDGAAARSKLAKQWVKENPGKEALIAMRKMAIFFLPKNYEVLPTFDVYNPVNAFVYILSIVGFGMLLFGRGITIDWSIVVMPIAGAILMSLIFFTSYRLRFYAEPLMCILAMWPLQQYFNKRKVVRADS